MLNCVQWVRVWVSLFVFCMWGGYAHAQTGPQSCLDNGGRSLCIKGELTFGLYTDSTRQFSETQGDAACAVYHFTSSNRRQTKGKWVPNHPNWGPTCVYEFCEFASTAGETSPRWHCQPMAGQNWVFINQWCPDCGLPTGVCLGGHSRHQP